VGICTSSFRGSCLLAPYSYLESFLTAEMDILYLLQKQDSHVTRVGGQVISAVYSYTGSREKKDINDGDTSYVRTLDTNFNIRGVPKVISRLKEAPALKRVRTFGTPCIYLTKSFTCSFARFFF
jgi:hypothetical protein